MLLQIGNETVVHQSHFIHLPYCYFYLGCSNVYWIEIQQCFYLRNVKHMKMADIPVQRTIFQLFYLKNNRLIYAKIQMVLKFPSGELMGLKKHCRLHVKLFIQQSRLNRETTYFYLSSCRPYIAILLYDMIVGIVQSRGTVTSADGCGQLLPN